MNDSASKTNSYIKNAKIKTIKYCELVYPVHNKRGAPIMHPDGTDDGQEEGEARRHQAQHLVCEAHSLSCGQRSIPQLEDAVTGRQCLL